MKASWRLAQRMVSTRPGKPASRHRSRPWTPALGSPHPLPFGPRQGRRPLRRKRPAWPYRRWPRRCRRPRPASAERRWSCCILLVLRPRSRLRGQPSEYEVGEAFDTFQGVTALGAPQVTTYTARCPANGVRSARALLERRPHEATMPSARLAMMIRVFFGARLSLLNASMPPVYWSTVMADGQAVKW